MFKKHKSYSRILIIYFLIVIGTFVASKLYRDPSVEFLNNGPIRRILSLDNCTKRSVEEFPPDFMSRKNKEHGGILLHIVISIYLFFTLAIVCDDYLVSSLDRICEVLHFKHDVAGAIFMSIGGSSPELCIAVIGIFITKSDVGVSTIVGSAIFNVLGVTAICGLFAGRVIRLTWWPIFRDCIVYCITIIILIIVMVDDIIHWYESLSMVIVYVGYVVILYNSNRLNLLVLKVLPKMSLVSNSEYTLLTAEKDKTAPYLGSSEDEEIMETGDVDSSHSRITLVDDNSGFEGEPESIFEIPNSFFKRLHWVALLPVNILCFLTIPDCRKPGIWRKLFIITFIMSLIWISLSTYVLVWMVCITGDTLGIPDTVMGLTLLAAMSSIPDAVSAFVVAKEGHGDMAVCTSIASNTLDILLGLGLAWFIQTGLVNPGSTIQIYSSSLTYTSMILLSTVVVLVVSIMLNKWRLNRLLGSFLFLLYMLSIIFACLYELNILGIFSLPPCPRTRL